jgi:hypothetical protein
MPAQPKDKVMIKNPKTVAELVISCLEAEGVAYLFGILGEENIRLIDATAGSRLTRQLLAQAIVSTTPSWIRAPATPTPTATPRSSWPPPRCWASS